MTTRVFRTSRITNAVNAPTECECQHQHEGTTDMDVITRTNTTLEAILNKSNASDEHKARVRARAAHDAARRPAHNLLARNMVEASADEVAAMLGGRK